MDASVSMNFKTENGKWIGTILKRRTLILKNIPTPNTEDKLPFHRWLKEEQGIEWEDWTTNYCGTMAEQIEEEYDYYFYDLPKFVQKYLQK